MRWAAPELPFVYVELCHELGAAEPKERDFWQYGQRAALQLPKVGFATTTDVDKSALHPPDKIDIATRLNLEVRRLALGQPVIGRGPELVSVKYDAAASELTISLSNSSLEVHQGVVVPPPAGGCHVPSTRAFSSTPAEVAEVAVNPLECFTESAPGARCFCNLEYPVHLPQDQSPESCAAACLNSSADCVSFLFQHTVLNSTANPVCRLSHTCRYPTRKSSIFRGYMRNCNKPGCGSCPPLPPPPPAPPAPPSLGPSGGVVMQFNGSSFVSIPFKIVGNLLVVKCTKGTEQEPVLINGDAATCFLYSKDSGLPAPPLSLPCSDEAADAKLTWAAMSPPPKSSPPPPKFAKNENNVAGSMPNPAGNSDGNVILLGAMSESAACEAAATNAYYGHSGSYAELGLSTEHAQ